MDRRSHRARRVHGVHDGAAVFPRPAGARRTRVHTCVQQSVGQAAPPAPIGEAPAPDNACTTGERCRRDRHLRGSGGHGAARLAARRGRITVTLQRGPLRLIVTSSGGRFPPPRSRRQGCRRGAPVDLIAPAANRAGLRVTIGDSTIDLRASLRSHRRETASGAPARVHRRREERGGLTVTRSYTIDGTRGRDDGRLEGAPPSVRTPTYDVVWASGMPSAERNLTQDESAFATVSDVGADFHQDRPPISARRSACGTGRSRTPAFAQVLPAPDPAARHRGYAAHVRRQGRAALAVRAHAAAPGRGTPRGTRSAVTSGRSSMRACGLRCRLERHREHGLVMDATGVAARCSVSRADPCGDSQLGIAIPRVRAHQAPVLSAHAHVVPQHAPDAGAPAAAQGVAGRSTRASPKKLNKETMALFKEHKANPRGGCLPMLVQMPVSSRSTGC